MKNLFIILTFLCAPLLSTSQIKFEKGYFISHQLVRTECLIKSVDWSYNPVSFIYKLSETGRPETATANDVQEFGVSNDYKYIAATVNIDRSSDELEYIGSDREPSWKKETLFLKVLTEGDATLYSYQEPNLTRFFYKAGGSPDIEQLIYKAFGTDEINFQYNKTYLTQLHSKVNCGNQSPNALEKILYTEPALKRYFLNYNRCKGTVSVTYSKEKQKWFSLKLAPSLRYSKLNGTFGASGSEVSFDPQFSFAAGVEAEFFLPFNKNKWALALLPSTFSYKSTGTSNRTIDYNTIEITGGIKYYFYPGEKFKIYPGAFVAKDIKRRSFTFAYGLGASYGRVFAELKHYTPKSALDYYEGDRLAFHKEALIIGFRIL